MIVLCKKNSDLDVFMENYACKYFFIKYDFYYIINI